MIIGQRDDEASRLRSYLRPKLRHPLEDLRRGCTLLQLLDSNKRACAQQVAAPCSKVYLAVIKSKKNGEEKFSW